MNSNGIGQASAYKALSGILTLGFKFLAWINGMGVFLVLLSALALVQTEQAAAVLKLPLAAFTAGLALCGLALLWSYLVQASLLSQMVAGQHRRTHWVPLFCAMVAYALSLAAFVVGCWFTLGLSSVISHDAESLQQSGGQDLSPLDQSGRVPEFEHEARPQNVVYFRTPT